jgi:hypothetical protein
MDPLANWSLEDNSAATGGDPLSKWSLDTEEAPKRKPLVTIPNPESADASALPDWMESLHKAIDPFRILGGPVGVAAMAIPAGPLKGPGAGPTMRAPAPATVNPSVEAGARIGVEIPRAAVDGPLSQNIAQKLSDVPIVGAPIEEASKKSMGQLSNAATNVEQGYGGLSAPQAGAGARDSITSYIGGKVKANKDKLYAQVDKLVDPAKKVPLPGTSNMVKAIEAERNAAGLGPSHAGNVVREAMGRPEGLTYAGIKTLRTNLGEMLNGNAPLAAGMSQSELKRVYGSLSDDLRNAIQTAGNPKALAAFERANRYTKYSTERSENLMRVLKANSDEGIVERITAAASSGSRADINLLSQARKASDPAAWDGVSSAVVSKLGRDPKTGDFSPSRFLTSWSKISQPAKSIMFRTTGKTNLAKALDDIAATSKAFDRLQSYANTSKTGASVATVGAITGAVTNPLLTVAAGVSGRVLAHLLAKPATAQAIATYSRAVLSNPQKIALAAKPLAVAIGHELDVDDRVQKRIFDALTGK